MKNLFNEKAAMDEINRIHRLIATTGPQWGKMTAAQMLAHCSVAYEFVYEEINSPSPMVL